MFSNDEILVGSGEFRIQNERSIKDYAGFALGAYWSGDKQGKDGYPARDAKDDNIYYLAGGLSNKNFTA